MSTVFAPASTTQSWTGLGHGVTIDESARTNESVRTGQAQRALPDDLLQRRVDGTSVSGVLLDLGMEGSTEEAQFA